MNPWLGKFHIPRVHSHNTKQNKNQQVLPSKFVGQEFGRDVARRFWLRVSCKVATKMSAGVSVT